MVHTVTSTVVQLVLRSDYMLHDYIKSENPTMKQADYSKS